MTKYQTSFRVARILYSLDLPVAKLKLLFHDASNSCETDSISNQLVCFKLYLLGGKHAA